MIGDAGEYNAAAELADELDSLVSYPSPTDRAENINLGITQIEIFLKKSLEVASSSYAFLLSPAGEGAYAEQFVRLSGIVERVGTGEVQPCYDTLSNRRPDPLILSVMRLNRPIEGRPTDIGLPQCLPSSHPPIRYYYMVPVSLQNDLTSVLFVANPRETESFFSSKLTLDLLFELAYVLAERQQELESNSDRNLRISEEESARHYVQLMSASLNAVVIVDHEGMITGFNPAAERLFDIGSSSALGIQFDRFVTLEFLMPILRQANMFESSGVDPAMVIDQQPIVAKNKKSEVLHLNASAYFTKLNQSVFTTFVLTHSVDILNLPETSSIHQQFKALTNVAPVGIVQLGVDWNCEYANAMWNQLSGLNLDESLYEGWVDAIHAEDVVDTLVDLREVLSENKIFTRNLRLHRPTGDVRWVSLSATVTIDEMGRFSGCLLVLLDVTDAHIASEKLRFSATHDALTGLANRNAFLDILQERLNSRNARKSTSLMYLDLDGFKAINDTLGHDCGDELLRKVAQRLSSVVSSAGVCARLGGDEFTVIVMHSIEEKTVCEMADRILNSFRETFDIHGNELYLATSIGIALGDVDTSSSDSFIKKADTALYKAKSSGRSQWVVYTREFEHADAKKLELEMRVHRACEKQEFTIEYQPQFKIDDCSIVSFEALLRWFPTDITPPDVETLISILENNGLITDVGHWVLEQACRQYCSWLELGLVADDCTMSVNVSAAQLSLASFVPKLEGVLNRYGMKPHQLNIEITESVVIEQNSNCIRVINEIKNMGVQLSLDDFGTGYASLSYLLRLPVDYLKIDKSFVMAMELDDSCNDVVHAVLAMAENLNVDVVAEGIENDKTLGLLKLANCKYGQGYFISKPLGALALEKYLVKDALEAQHMITLA